MATCSTGVVQQPQNTGRWNNDIWSHQTRSLDSQYAKKAFVADPQPQTHLWAYLGIRERVWCHKCRISVKENLTTEANIIVYECTVCYLLVAKWLFFTLYFGRGRGGERSVITSRTPPPPSPPTPASYGTAKHQYSTSSEVVTRDVNSWTSDSGDVPKMRFQRLHAGIWSMHRPRPFATRRCSTVPRTAKSHGNVIMWDSHWWTRCDSNWDGTTE